MAVAWARAGKGRARWLLPVGWLAAGEIAVAGMVSGWLAMRPLAAAPTAQPTGRRRLVRPSGLRLPWLALPPAALTEFSWAVQPV
jgi:hypothetical protein